MPVRLIILFIVLIAPTYYFITSCLAEKGNGSSDQFSVRWFLASIVISALLVVLLVAFAFIAGIAIHSMPAINEYVRTLF